MPHLKPAPARAAGLPTVSIITVCFNSARTIGDTLRSVAAQHHANIEHIVIDGGSTDDTLAMVRSAGAHVAQLVSEPDGGIYDAMNKGLARANGDVVGFLNSDDMLAGPDVIGDIARAFATHPTDAVFGNLVFVDQLDVSRTVRYWQATPHTPGACARGWMPPHPTLYVRRDLLQASGGFCLDYRLQADFELILRLFEVQGLRALHLPQVLIRMRMGGATTGSLRNVIRGNLEASRACRRNGFPGGALFIARKLLSRIPQFFAGPGAAIPPQTPHLP